MKNAFKLGFLALAVTLTVAACKGSGSATTTDSAKVDSAKMDSAKMKDTTSKMAPADTSKMKDTTKKK